VSTDRRRLAEWLRYDVRISVLAFLAGLPGVGVALILLWTGAYTPRLQWTLSLLLLLGWGVGTLVLRERLIRPLQVLSNLLAGLREGDYSIRARGTGANDPLGLAFMEVNALEEILREQRLGAVEAEALLRKVMAEIDVAIFAFDDQDALQLVNRAGERLLGRSADRLRGRLASELRLRDVLAGPAPRTVDVSFPGGSGRWEVRRSVVRQEGLPLKLLVLSDLSRALREEERMMWQRLVRVLSHEINNSLAPIKSIAGSLQTLTGKGLADHELNEDLSRGLRVIQTRAEGLGRFMSSYATLARLPAPELEPVALGPLVERVASLETRVEVVVEEGPELVVHADGDQLEQALINLIRNAADASLETGGGVTVRWLRRAGQTHLIVEDEGPGIADASNLFVPFYTTKQGGSGIGLVLSRQIAEGHGGSLVLEGRGSEPGARARLTLPMAGTDSRTEARDRREGGA
jgi:nitrogen fixation/metabolism regulation signal transduction histidine kinase